MKYYYKTVSGKSIELFEEYQIDLSYRNIVEAVIPPWHQLMIHHNYVEKIILSGKLNHITCDATIPNLDYIIENCRDIRLID